MANQREFAVMGRAAATGTVHLLKRGFATVEEAEDHPVKMAHWSSVWVAEVEPPPDRITYPPPLPWNVEWTNGRCYLIDAEGRKLATLYGTQERREAMVAMLLEHFGFNG